MVSLAPTVTSVGTVPTVLGVNAQVIVSSFRLRIYIS